MVLILCYSVVAFRLDPVASRLMWRLLARIRDSGSMAIVLTTHNMLEFEAVCTRVGIMKAGEMICLGDSQHLRSAHGTGMMLELHLRSEGLLHEAKRFVNDTFPSATLIEESGCMLNYEIPAASIGRLSVAFRTIEQNKDRLCADDYVLCQATLEQGKYFEQNLRIHIKD